MQSQWKNDSYLNKKITVMGNKFYIKVYPYNLQKFVMEAD